MAEEESQISHRVGQKKGSPSLQLPWQNLYLRHPDSPSSRQFIYALFAAHCLTPRKD